VFLSAKVERVGALEGLSVSSHKSLIKPGPHEEAFQRPAQAFGAVAE